MLNQFGKVATVAVSAMLCCASGRAESKCHDVAGGITTNFVDSSDTLGSATGDLAGGLGVHVFNQQQGPWSDRHDVPQLSARAESMHELEKARIMLHELEFGC